MGPGTTEDSYRVDSSRSMGLGTPLRKAPWNFIRRFGRPSPGPAGRLASPGESGEEPSSPSNRLAREERGKASPPEVPLSSPGGSTTSPGAAWGPSPGSAIPARRVCVCCSACGGKTGGQAEPGQHWRLQEAPPPTWANSAAASCFKATVVMTGAAAATPRCGRPPAPGRSPNRGLFEEPGDVESASSAAARGTGWMGRGRGHPRAGMLTPLTRFHSQAPPGRWATLNQSVSQAPQGSQRRRWRRRGTVSCVPRSATLTSRCSEEPCELTAQGSGPHSPSSAITTPLTGL